MVMRLPGQFHEVYHATQERAPVLNHCGCMAEEANERLQLTLGCRALATPGEHSSQNTGKLLLWQA